MDVFGILILEQRLTNDDLRRIYDYLQNWIK